jgi:hypothetical protein
MSGAFQRAGTEMERSLINPHQSVHLLAEEMGVHLPRAVVTALSHMLPSIGEIGGALLAIFAVRAAVEWSVKAYEGIQHLRGATKELENEWKVVVAEQEKFLTNFKTISGGNKLIGETVRRLSEVESRIEKMKKDIEELDRGAHLKAAFIQSLLSKLEDERSMLVDRLNKQLVNSTELHIKKPRNNPRRMRLRGKRRFCGLVRSWRSGRNLNSSRPRQPRRVRPTTKV